MGAHDVVMAAPGEGRMGIATAASVIGDMVRSFSNLRFILLVGIAGGVPTVRDVRLGDVVVGVPAYSEGGVSQYDFDVSAQDAEFKQKGHLNAPHEKILAAVRRLKATHITTGNGLEDRIATAIAGFRRGKIFSRPTTDMLYKASYTHPRGHGAVGPIVSLVRRIKLCQESLVTKTKRIWSLYSFSPILFD